MLAQQKNTVERDISDTGRQVAQAFIIFLLYKVPEPDN